MMHGGGTNMSAMLTAPTTSLQSAASWLFKAELLKTAHAKACLAECLDSGDADQLVLFPRLWSSTGVV